MSEITILGGCGQIGSMAVRALLADDTFDKLVIAEKRVAEAEELACELQSPRVEVVEVDAEDEESLTEVMRGSSVVLNCIGPFYRFGPPVLSAAIRAGVNYVDVCDDLDATEKMLSMDDAAQSAGISALIGMGNSPGMANLFARFASEQMLDETESVDIYHVHGGEPVEGPAVVKHRIHAMTSDIPVFLDGEFKMVRMLEESGESLVEQTDFKDIGTYPTYPYPHPETITIPENIPGVTRVANLGFVLPPAYFQMTMDAVRLGICGEDPIIVQGREVVPIEFAVSFILSERPRLLEEAWLSGPMGCLKVVVGGTRDGEKQKYVFSMSSKGAGAGEGTGIPAAMGAILMSQGKVTSRGVVPPEAAVVPTDMLELGGHLTRELEMDGGVPLQLEHIDAEGNRAIVEIKF